MAEKWLQRNNTRPAARNGFVNQISNPLSKVRRVMPRPQHRARLSNFSKLALSKYGKPVQLFKDSDKDGVANVFDCKPYNKRKQDVMHPAYNSSNMNITEMYYRREQARQNRLYQKQIEEAIRIEKENQRLAALNPQIVYVDSGNGSSGNSSTIDNNTFFNDYSKEARQEIVPEVITPKMQVDYHTYNPKLNTPKTTLLGAAKAVFTNPVGAAKVISKGITRDIAKAIVIAPKIAPKATNIVKAIPQAVKTIPVVKAVSSVVSFLRGGKK